MKSLRFILPGLVIAAAAGLLCYQAFVTKDLESGDIVRCVVIMLGALLTMLKLGTPNSKKGRKAMYKAAFPHFIQDVFTEEPKLEKKFFNAVELFNREKFPAALDILLDLRKECRTTSDIVAVTVFTALCCDRMQIYPQAITQYRVALSLRPNSTLASNLGTCYHAMGEIDNAISAYEQAIRLDAKNAKAYNNLSALHFKNGDFAAALELAETAVSIDATLPQALSTAAICCHFLGREEQYKAYYRRAVAAGYNGKLIKQAIESLSID